MCPEDLRKFILFLLKSLIVQTKSFFGSMMRDQFHALYEGLVRERGISRATAEQYLKRLVHLSIALDKAPRFKLAKTTLQITIITDFLNKNPIFKEQVLPGVTEEISEQELISYYNLRAMPAIMADWEPAKAKHHKLSPIKDESISWSETNGIIIFRQKHDCILTRGDTRAPDEVLTARGFSPTVPLSAIAVNKYCVN